MINWKHELEYNELMNYGCKPNIRTESIALRIQIGIRVDTGSKNKKKEPSILFTNNRQDSKIQVYFK